MALSKQKREKLKFEAFVRGNRDLLEKVMDDPELAEKARELIKKAREEKERDRDFYGMSMAYVDTMEQWEKEKVRKEED